MGLAANPTVVSRLTGAEPEAVRRNARTASAPADLPPARELLAYLARDPETELIALYIEGVRDGRRFLAVLREAVRTVYASASPAAGIGDDGESVEAYSVASRVMR